MRHMAYIIAQWHSILLSIITFFDTFFCSERFSQLETSTLYGIERLLHVVQEFFKKDDGSQYFKM